jgi:voltage-gated potassium channel
MTQDYASEMGVAERIDRLEKYETRSAPIFFALALLYIVIYAFLVLALQANPLLIQFLEIASNVIWISFIFDLAYRTYLAPNRLTYLARHPVDVLAVVVPAFRALRILRVLTAAQWLFHRGERLPIQRAALVVLSSVSLLALLGALAVLDAERFAAGSTITNFGDAIWWSFVTMSTVGYGDFAPVTFTGRAVAVGLMVVGIGLLAGLAGMFASGLISRITGNRQNEVDELHSVLKRIEEKLVILDRQMSQNVTNQIRE